MHEVSLCRSLASAVARTARTRRVTDVFVDVGALRQVVPDALSFAWTFVVRGTALDGAELHINAIPAVLACDDCGATVELGPELGFGCASCGSGNTHLSSGEEFTLTAIEVDGPSTPNAGDHRATDDLPVTAPAGQDHQRPGDD